MHTMDTCTTFNLNFSDLKIICCFQGLVLLLARILPDR